MQAVIQRVLNAEVTIDGESIGLIGRGLLVLLGVGKRDTKKDADYLAEKIVHLRLFEDKSGKMNLSLSQVNGKLLVVSQFTLLADCRKGRRPSFTNAAPPEKAKSLYHHFIDTVRQKGIKTETGKFQAMMAVSLTNDGPVTIILDSER